jgi:hypothetical protein
MLYKFMHLDNQLKTEESNQKNHKLGTIEADVTIIQKNMMQNSLWSIIFTNPVDKKYFLWCLHCIN